MTTWRITGTELFTGPELDAGQSRRRAEVSWDNGLVVEPGSEWVIAELAQLDGHLTGLGPSGGQPVFRVDLSDRASAYWATMSLLHQFEVEGDLPERTWRDETPEGAVN